MILFFFYWTLTLFAGAALSLFLHELSHLVVVKYLGGTIVSFKPWPHNDRGNSYFGKVVCKINPAISKRSIHLAPLVKMGVFANVWLLIGIFVCPFALILSGCELIDGIWWWKGYFYGPSQTDGARLRRGA